MKNLFFIPKLLKRGSFFIHIFASKLLKNSLQSLGMEKKKNLNLGTKKKLLAKFRDQNSILPF